MKDTIAVLADIKDRAAEYRRTILFVGRAGEEHGNEILEWGNTVDEVGVRWGEQGVEICGTTR